MSDGIKESGIYVFKNGKWSKWDGVLNGEVDIKGVLINEDYDYVSVTYPTTSSEVYVFKTGGSGGSTVATVTISYTDTTKEYILTVTKS